MLKQNYFYYKCGPALWHFGLRRPKGICCRISYSITAVTELKDRNFDTKQKLIRQLEWKLFWRKKYPVKQIWAYNVAKS